MSPDMENASSTQSARELSQAVQKVYDAGWLSIPLEIQEAIEREYHALQEADQDGKDS